VKRLKQTEFDPRPFLPHLSFFDGFDAAEIDEIVGMGSLLELPRGHPLFHLGQPTSAVFVVLRGAVEICAQNARRQRRMAVLGPGQLIGYMSAVEKGTHGSDAIVREPALLLEIASPAFEKLYFGGSTTSIKLRRTIQSTLLNSLGQTNRHLTRLISLAKLRSEESEALEKVLASQIVWTLGETPAG
jgi:CRP-like cAMP-binding protein